MLGTKRKDDFEPYWQNEKDWLCIVDPSQRSYPLMPSPMSC